MRSINIYRCSNSCDTPCIHLVLVIEDNQKRMMQLLLCIRDVLINSKFIWMVWWVKRIFEIINFQTMWKSFESPRFHLGEKRRDKCCHRVIVLESWRCCARLSNLKTKRMMIAHRCVRSVLSAPNRYNTTNQACRLMWLGTAGRRW